MRALHIVLAAALLTVAPARAQEPAVALPLDTYISTGDHHWLVSALPVDSQAAIESSFDLLQALGVRRIYWRGLQEATMVATMHARADNFRYARWIEWARHLIEDLDIEHMAVEAAHARGMELWGVGTLGDWGCTADTPGFGDYPWFWESTLRLEHPEWVPVDKYGYRRQGGPIELSYPEARAALVDLHARLTRAAGYDGVLFITYVENFSMRFPEEFAYNEPIVADFRRHFGRDPRIDPFSRNFSRTDFHRLRGDHVTEYLHELKAALPAGTGLGMFINPREPHYPQVWSTLPQDLCTLGRIYLDLDTWVREGIIDQLIVYGASNSFNQPRTIEDMLWLTRDTQTAVSFNSSSPTAAVYEPFRGRVDAAVLAVAEDKDYLLRSGVPEAEASALTAGPPLARMRYLAQVVAGTSEASVTELVPLAEGGDIVTRRLALRALAVIGDPAGLPVIEDALFDSEPAVRGMAMYALGITNRPESTARILAALAQFHEHPLHEAARSTLARIRPAPRAEIVAACDHPDEAVRTTALRALRLLGPTDEDVPLLVKHLDDSHRYAAYSAAEALGAVVGSEAALRALIAATRHPDAAIADRAVTSIADAVRRSDAATVPLRAELLAAARDLFAQMGDGCTRSDREWGYRPAGEALLVFGAEGEAVLRAFMEQSDDRRLAELAWRVLYLREKAGANEFRVVCEEDSDAAFALRPAWLPRLRAARFAEGFDDPARWTPEVTGMVGDARRSAGRWGVFGGPGPTIDPTQAHSAPHSVRLSALGQLVHGYTLRDVTDGRDWDAEAWLLREQGAAVLVEVSGRTPVIAPEVTARVDGEGAVLLRDAAADTWADTGLRVEAGVWTRLRIVGERGRGSAYAAVMTEDGEEQSSPVRVPLDIRRDLYMIRLVPEAGALNVDDIALSERL